jgi:hypothetical protein
MLADVPAIDEHVVLVSDAVDADRTEGERLKTAAAGESPMDGLHCFHVTFLNAIHGKPGTVARFRKAKLSL